MPCILLGRVDRCVCCGEPVPEGTQVCPECLKQAEDATKKVIRAFAKAVTKCEAPKKILPRSKAEAASKATMEDRLLQYLKLYHTGKENAVYSKELEQRFSMGGRSIRRVINQLRQDGNPICSNCRGYYFARSQEDVNKTVKWLNGLVTGVSNARTGLLYSPVSNGSGTVTITIEVS